MYLNVILTILVITLITMTTLAIIWWKKYGKTIFYKISNANGMIPKEILSQMGKMDMGSMFSNLNNMMNQIKNTKNGKF